MYQIMKVNISWPSGLATCPGRHPEFTLSKLGQAPADASGPPA